MIQHWIMSSQQSKRMMNPSSTRRKTAPEHGTQRIGHHPAQQTSSIQTNDLQDFVHHASITRPSLVQHSSSTRPALALSTRPAFAQNSPRTRPELVQNSSERSRQASAHCAGPGLRSNTRRSASSSSASSVERAME
jgi:hypothetical protein